MGFFRGLNTIFLTAAAGFSAVAGNNAVFNGGFELGTEGWGLIKSLRIDTNPELKIRKLSVDTTDPAEGKQSLYLDNRQSEAFRIFSRSFPLKANTRYRFSGKVKCDQENFNLVIMPCCTKRTSGRQYWINRHCFIRTKKSWTAVSKEFDTGKDGDGWWRFLITPNGYGYQRKEIMPVQLWFDDLKIEEIGGDPNTPEIQVAAVPAQNIYERDDKTQVRITVKMFNTSDKAKNADFTVVGRDVYFQNILFQKKFSEKLEPKEKRELFFEIPADRYGCIRLDAEGNDIHGLPRRYVVIGKYSGGPVDVTKDFVVGINMNFDYGAPPTYKYPSYKVIDSDFGEKVRIFRQMGLRLMRDHCSGGAMTGWDAMNPEPGKWDFTHADRCWKIAEKNGIMVLPVLGGYLTEKDHKNPNIKYHMPQYMIPKSKLTKGITRRMLRLPPEKEWKEFIAKAVGHFKGKIPVYEITNEPNIDIPAEIYLDYLKWSYETIREIDPDAKVAGFCLSSDFSTQTGPWALKLMKLGGLKYLDILSYHPYNSRTLNSVIAADKDIQNIRTMAAKYGKKELDLWQTELFYFYPVRTVAGNESEHFAPKQSALWAIRTFIDLGEGVTQAISPDETQFFESLLQENCGERNPDELLPNDFFVVGNALARLFEGAKIVSKKRDEENGTATYVFNRKGKRIAAVWNYLDRKGVSLKKPDGLQVLDLYGNEITSAEIPVEESPLYLLADNLSEKQFDEALSKLEYVMKQTVMASPLVRTAGKKAFVSLHNIVSRPGSGYAGITGGKSAQRFSLSGKGSGYVETELNTPDPSMKIMVSAGGKPNFFPAKECPCKMVPAKTTLKLGEGDFRAEAAMELKKDVFELTLRVYDSTDAGPTGKRKMWETDCVELFFDERPIPLRLFHGSDYDQFVSRVFMQPRDDGKLTVWSRRFSVKDCRSELKVLPDGYQWKFQIPVSCERFLGFDLKISDGIAGSTKIKSGISWSGNEKRIRDRTAFGLIEKEEIEK